MLSEEQAQRIREGLDRIPDTKNRQIIELYFFESLSLSQVSIRVGLHHETVKKRFRSTLRSLEDLQSDLDGD